MAGDVRHGKFLAWMGMLRGIAGVVDRSGRTPAGPPAWRTARITTAGCAAGRTIRAAAHGFEGLVRVTPKSGDGQHGFGDSEEKSTETVQVGGVSRRRPLFGPHRRSPVVGRMETTTRNDGLEVPTRRGTAEVLDDRWHAGGHDRLRLRTIVVTFVPRSPPGVVSSTAIRLARSCGKDLRMERWRSERHQRGAVDEDEAEDRHERQHAPPSIEPQATDHGVHSARPTRSCRPVRLPESPPTPAGA